jgi:hypothetical protein
MLKTVFAVIGFTFCSLWAYHFYNSSPVAKKSVHVASDSAWNATSPYLNDAVNKAQAKSK